MAQDGGPAFFLRCCDHRPLCVFCSIQQETRAVARTTTTCLFCSCPPGVDRFTATILARPIQTPKPLTVEVGRRKRTTLSSIFTSLTVELPRECRAMTLMPCKTFASDLLIYPVFKTHSRGWSTQPSALAFSKRPHDVVVVVAGRWGCTGTSPCFARQSVLLLLLLAVEPQFVAIAVRSQFLVFESRFPRVSEPPTLPRRALGGFEPHFPSIARSILKHTNRGCPTFGAQFGPLSHRIAQHNRQYLHHKTVQRQQMMIMKLFQTTMFFFFFFCSGVALSGVTAASSESESTTSESTTASLSFVPVPPFLVNCRTCPFGFYDGCNVCGCSNSSGAIPKTSFCTQRYCPKHAYGRPSCSAKYDPPAMIGCQTCPYGFYDGCNTCGCAGTRVSFCTLRYCSRAMTGTPKCNSRPKPPQPALLPSNVDCRTCPQGYFDGCNECLCGADDTTTGACTKRACPTIPMAPPKCN
jgi:hypothetical protein